MHKTLKKKIIKNQIKGEKEGIRKEGIRGHDERSTTHHINTE